MVKSGWGVWAFSPCCLLLVICSSVCLSRPPHIKPADCSRKEHPVVSYQGECITISLLLPHLAVSQITLVSAFLTYLYRAQSLLL